MVVIEKRPIKWTETARLQLLEAVITVESEQLRTESYKTSRDSPAQGLRKLNMIDKWNAVADLLPVEFREKIWNRKRQMYSELPKCCSRFSSLLQAYRDKRAGKDNKASRWVLTGPEVKLLEKREDLVNAGRSARAESSLKQLSYPTPNSSERQSSVQEEGAVRSLEHIHKLESAEEVFRYREREERTQVDQGKSNRDARIRWTETARVLLIEAVIHVEDEIRNKLFQPSSHKGMGKWERVANLLPHELRGKTWNYRAEMHKGYKCRSQFSSLFKDYAIMKRGCRKGLRCGLTKPVYELMKKRENLLKAQTSIRAENGPPLGSPNRVRTPSANDQKQLLAASINSLNTDGTQGYSSERPSLGRARELEGATFISEHMHESHGPEVRALYFDNDEEEAEADQIPYQNSMKRRAAESSQRWSPCRTISVSHGSDKKKNPKSSRSLRYASRPISNFRDSGETAKPSGARPRSGVETRAPAQTQKFDFNSSRRPPSYPRSPSSARENLTSTPHERYDEHLYANLDGPLRRVDLEFSSLRAWVQSQSIPFEKNIMNETSWAMRSGSRRKLNAGTATEPFHDLPDDSRTGWIYLQMQASFQKLRVRFSEELKNVSAEIAEVLQQDTVLLRHSSPDPDHGVTRSQCPSERRSTSPHAIKSGKRQCEKAGF